MCVPSTQTLRVLELGSQDHGGFQNHARGHTHKRIGCYARFEIRFLGGVWFELSTKLAEGSDVDSRRKTRRLSDGEEAVDGGTLTLGAVAGGDVGHGELAEVVADHLGLDLGVDEEATGVDADDGADHLGHDDHVTQVRLDHGGLLVGLALGLGLAQTLDEAHGLALEAALELSAGTGVDDLHEVLVGHVEERVELDTTVGELAESSLALELGSGGGVVVIPASGNEW
ncbi:hypothetical protein L1887_51915 [Cichorium endivia]|nr:hypothetical protein L1887_51915 [Cichorium endivia]